ncbi:hypothetical protein WG66_011102 [Moniliophthora roreri]|nr:hypothetical protein WG66_011102 [Moniliophthora roreri]
MPYALRPIHQHSYPPGCEEQRWQRELSDVWLENYGMGRGGMGLHDGRPGWGLDELGVEHSICIHTAHINLASMHRLPSESAALY